MYLSDDEWEIVFQYLTVNELYNNVGAVNKRFWNLLRSDEAFLVYSRYHANHYEWYENSKLAQHYSFAAYSIWNNYCEVNSVPFGSWARDCWVFDLRKVLKLGSTPVLVESKWISNHAKDGFTVQSVDDSHFLFVFPVAGNPEHCVLLFGHMSHWGIIQRVYGNVYKEEIVTLPKHEIDSRLQSGTLLDLQHSLFTHVSEDSTLKSLLKVESDTAFDAFLYWNMVVLNENWKANRPATITRKNHIQTELDVKSSFRLKLKRDPPGLMEYLRRFIITRSNENILRLVFNALSQNKNAGEYFKWLWPYLTKYLNWTIDDFLAVFTDRNFPLDCKLNIAKSANSSALSFIINHTDSSFSQIIVNSIEQFLFEQREGGIFHRGERLNFFAMVRDSPYSKPSRWLELVDDGQMLAYFVNRDSGLFVLDSLIAISRKSKKTRLKIAQWMSSGMYSEVLSNYLNSHQVSSDIIRWLLAALEYFELKDVIMRRDKAGFTALDQLISRQELEEESQIEQLLRPLIEDNHYSQRPELTEQIYRRDNQLRSQQYNVDAAIDVRIAVLHCWKQSIKIRNKLAGSDMCSYRIQLTDSDFVQNHVSVLELEWQSVSGLSKNPTMTCEKLQSLTVEALHKCNILWVTGIAMPNPDILAEAKQLVPNATTCVYAEVLNNRFESSGSIAQARQLVENSGFLFSTIDMDNDQSINLLLTNSVKHHLCSGDTRPYSQDVPHYKSLVEMTSSSGPVCIRFAPDTVERIELKALPIPDSIRLLQSQHSDDISIAVDELAQFIQDHMSNFEQLYRNVLAFNYSHEYVVDLISKLENETLERIFSDILIVVIDWMRYGSPKSAVAVCKKLFDNCFILSKQCQQRSLSILGNFFGANVLKWNEDCEALLHTVLPKCKMFDEVNDINQKTLLFADCNPQISLLPLNSTIFSGSFQEIASSTLDTIIINDTVRKSLAPNRKFTLTTSGSAVVISNVTGKEYTVSITAALFLSQIQEFRDYSLVELLNSCGISHRTANLRLLVELLHQCRLITLKLAVRTSGTKRSKVSDHYSWSKNDLHSLYISVSSQF